jgi:hypothetical protein
VIGKVLRGTRAGRLLYYLYGPGRANEHVDPHLVAGFDDPAELEPGRRADGSRDFRRLAGLLAQPLAALEGPGYARPVWHCPVRAAPGDRHLGDDEWAQVAADVMHRTGLAPRGDDAGVRWVAVRHGPDHVHIVATLGRQDGTRPRIWNDFYRVREACRAAEDRLGLRATALADRTAARRAGRAETEHAARRGWAEPPWVTLRREVCAAAAGARSEAEFFAALDDAGVLVRHRFSAVRPGEVTGYAVGLPGHRARGGGVVWFGGGKLAADLTLPKLRTRWAGAAAEHGAGYGLSDAAARVVLRATVRGAAEQARSEAAFFARLAEAGVGVRLRYSEVYPGQVTGYSVTLPGHRDGGGAAVWFSGGRLADSLTLPRLRRRWDAGHALGAERSAAGAEHHGAGAERSASGTARSGPGPGRSGRVWFTAAEHIRRCAASDPGGAADAAYAAADTLHVAARAVGSRVLRRAAGAYDRAARAPHGRIPRHSGDGDRLRAAARVMALAGQAGGDPAVAAAALVTSLLALATAVTELRQAQQHAAQAAAARTAAEQLHAAAQVGSQASTWAQAEAPRRARPASATRAGAERSRLR